MLAGQEMSLEIFTDWDLVVSDHIFGIWQTYACKFEVMFDNDANIKVSISELFLPKEILILF